MSSFPKIISQKYIDEDTILRETVSLWEEGSSETIMIDDKPIPGTIGSGPHIGKPVFQTFSMVKSFMDGGTMVAESQNCVSFIPAGFRKAPTKNTMNPVREEIGGSSALMSLVHVLTIPKDIRIFNACTLERKHLSLLGEMKGLGEKAVDILRSGPKEMIGSLQWVLHQKDMIKMEDDTTKCLVVTKEDMSPSCHKNLMIHDHGMRVVPGASTKIMNSFHVYPCSSIGWLHLHSYLGDLLTTAYDTMEAESQEKYGVPKNTPYETIVNSL
jgi:hypothetical protein